MTPDEELSQIIIDELVRSSLLNPDRAVLLSSQIASGAMTIEDWSLAIELSALRNESTNE